MCCEVQDSKGKRKGKEKEKWKKNGGCCRVAECDRVRPRGTRAQVSRLAP